MKSKNFFFARLLHRCYSAGALPGLAGLSLYFAQSRGTSGRHLRIYQAERDEPFGPFTSITEALRAGDDVYG
jgi:hypothetical protein